MSFLAEMNSNHRTDCVCNGCIQRGAPWDHREWNETWNTLGNCKHCKMKAGQHHAGYSNPQNPIENNTAGRCFPYDDRRIIKTRAHLSEICLNSWFEEDNVNPS